MKITNVYLIGLVFVISASAEPLLEGRVQLDSGEPVADAQVRLFDMSDLRQGAIARAMTDGTGYFALPLAALSGQALPARFALGPNYPNPFNPSTIIPYQLAASSEVRLEVFNLLGQHIATLVDGERAAGFHTATWHATDGAGRAVGAGVYIYRMTVGMESQTGRMVLVDGQAGVSAAGAASVWSGVSSGDGSTGRDVKMYGLIVSGEGLAPYVDSAFRVESGMVPVELVVSEGVYSAGKITDDDCPLCGFLGDGEHTIEDGQGGHTAPEADEPEEEAAEEEEEDTEEEETDEEETEGETYETSEDTGSQSGTGRSEWDLVTFHSFEVSDNTLTAGQAFTLETTLQKREANPLVVNLRYVRSLDATIDAIDAVIHEDWKLVDPETTAIQTVSLDWTAPSYAGTYYYGVCEGFGLEFSDCSTGVRVTVEGSKGGSPDLMVAPLLVSHSSVTLGSRFTWTAPIENIGTGPAAATSLRYYLSDDATIDATDRLVWIFDFPSRKASEEGGLGYTSESPAEAGTYYVGICVDPVPGEININNNCSVGVRLIVEAGGSPDLIVRLPMFKEFNRTTRSLRIDLQVINIGAGMSADTEVRFYRSDDAIIDATDELYVYNLGNIAAESFAGIYVWGSLSAPASPGTYYYTACVDPVPGGSDTNNNCSETVPMSVGVPDLAVGLAWASTSVPLVGESFTLTATVRNQGPNEAGSTTLRFYRSDDATIDATDTPIGTNTVSSLTGFDGLVSGPGSRLSASGTSRKSISVSAPSSPGTYYYGACVDPVSREANTDNNCSSGVYLRVVPAGEDPFNIELVFVNDFTDAHKDVMQQAARRWESIITEGLSDVNFSAKPHSLSLGGETIVVDDTVDDLRIFVYKDATVPLGVGGPSYVRSGNPTGLPAIGRIWIGASGLARYQSEEPLYQEENLLRDLMLHETAHVLGFGPLWGDSGLVRELSGDTHFSGERAIQAFNAAGGEDYSWNKVPVVFGDLAGGCSAGSHWRHQVFRGLDRQFGAEIMEPTQEREHRLSAITIQSLADLGYVVDVSRADPYKLPASVSTALTRPSSAKPVASHDFDLGVGAFEPIYVGDEQGRISHTINSD